MAGRYGFWFVFGCGVSLLHGLMIARSVRRLDPGSRRITLRRAAGGAFVRVLTAAGAMGMALVDGGLAAVVVAVGLVVGRWCFVLGVASGRFAALTR